MTICLRQILKVGDDKKNKGNCSICKADYKNRNCSGYIPFRLFYVKEEGDKNVLRKTPMQG